MIQEPEGEEGKSKAGVQGRPRLRKQIRPQSWRPSQPPKESSGKADILWVSEVKDQVDAASMNYQQTWFQPDQLVVTTTRAQNYVWMSLRVKSAVSAALGWERQGLCWEPVLPSSPASP